MGIDYRGKTPPYMQIADELRHGIRAGRYGPGGLLPSESDLIAEYGVARLTARKARRVLVAEGLVEIIPGRGAYVREAAA